MTQNVSSSKAHAAEAKTGASRTGTTVWPSLTPTLDELAAWLEKTALEEVEIEHEGLRVRLKKPGAMAAPQVVAAPQAAVVQTVAAPAAEAAGEDLFKSPLVGTFYAAASPEAAPFVQEGDSVKEGQVLGIIEAMKTMNQLTSDRSGTVRKVMVKNASPVEFGQPLFVIQ